MKKKWIGAIAVVSLLGISVVVKLTQRKPEMVVETEKVGLHEIRSSILASGGLAYEDQALLSPELIGRVAEIFVKEGDKVDKGQLVLRLDDQTYRAQIAQQEAAVRQQTIAIEQRQLNVENKASLYHRQQELHAKKMVSDQALDDARFAVDQAKVELRNTRESLQQAEAGLKQFHETLAKTTVRAPIGGTVTSLNIKVGETAVAGQVGIAGSSLMTVANTATIMTEVNVDEADIAKVKIGQDVSVHAAAFPDTEIKGKVKSIPLSPRPLMVGGGQARNYAVKVSIDDAKGLALRPGMTCRAEIYTSGGNKSLAVPVQAVLSNNNEREEVPKKDKGKAVAVKEESYVIVDKNGVADKRVVKVGISDDSMQEIVNGLQAGESIVTGPYKILRTLANGTQLKVESGVK